MKEVKFSKLVAKIQLHMPSIWAGMQHLTTIFMHKSEIKVLY